MELMGCRMLRELYEVVECFEMRCLEGKRERRKETARIHDQVLFVTPMSVIENF